MYRGIGRDSELIKENDDGKWCVRQHDNSFLCAHMHDKILEIMHTNLFKIEFFHTSRIVLNLVWEEIQAHISVAIRER